MTKYILKRIGMMVFVLFGVLLFIFILLRVTPGDPARQVLGVSATDEQIEAQREIMGLNDPFLVRFQDYVGDLVLHFDLGTSYITRQPVVKEIAQRFPTTLKLGLLGMLLSLLVGIPTGILSAVKQYSWTDKICNIFAVICTSMPSFWLGLELSLIFALKLKWLPATGYKGFIYLILPIITLGVAGAASNYRMSRSSVLEEIRQDYVRTVRAKGQVERKAVMNHAVRNALIPIITVIGNSLGSIMGGAVIVECVFSIPGLGSYMLSAISNRDYPVIQGSVFVIAFFVSCCTLLTDIVYALVDPRIKAQYKRSVAKRGEKSEAQK
jgi:peptide/nickel transport system permease protein